MSAAGGGVIPDIIHDLPIFHPVNNHLMWIDCSTEALDNVRMLQSHPDGDLLVKRLVTVDRVNRPIRREGGLLTFSLSLRSFSPSLPATLFVLRQTLLLFEFSLTSSPLRTLAKPPEANSFSSTLETPSEIIYESGSTPRLPQVLHKACKACWNRSAFKFSTCST
jgi:hypothetical protein